MGYSELLNAASTDLTTDEQEIEVSTGKGDDKKTGVIKVRLPKSLSAAVKIFGEDPNAEKGANGRQVYRLFINSLVVAIQGEERPKLKEKVAGERKKAPYLEALGL